MPRKGPVAKRDVLPDPIYNSKLVTRLINRLMVDGKRGKAATILYNAFDIVKEKTGNDPMEVFEQASLRPSYKGSDRKTKNLIISRPKDKLKKDSANIAMESIIGANLFEKDGVQLYEGRRDAYYKTRRVDVFL